MRMIIIVILLAVAGFMGWHTYQGTQAGLTPMAAAGEAAKEGGALIQAAGAKIASMMNKDDAVGDEEVGDDTMDADEPTES